MERVSFDLVFALAWLLSPSGMVVVRLLDDLFATLTRFATDVVGFAFVTEGRGMMGGESGNVWRDGWGGVGWDEMGRDGIGWEG